MRAQHSVFFFILWSCTHTHTHKQRERDESDSWMLQQADARHETNWAVLKNCFCLLAANCATLCEEHERRERMSSAAGEHRVTTETELTYEHRAQPAQASPTVDSRRESEIQKNVNVKLPAGIRTARERAQHAVTLHSALFFWSVWAVGCGPWWVVRVDWLLICGLCVYGVGLTVVRLTRWAWLSWLSCCYCYCFFSCRN